MSFFPENVLKNLCNENIGRNDLSTKRDMVCALEKYPGILFQAQSSSQEIDRQQKNACEYPPMPGFYESLANVCGDLDGSILSMSMNSTMNRINDWLLYPRLLKCSDCKSMLKHETMINDHLVQEHNLRLGSELIQAQDLAFLFKVSGFQGIMSLYLWIRPGAPFKTLTSLVANRWMAPCFQCKHLITLYQNSTEDQRSVYYNHYHNKVIFIKKKIFLYLN